MNTSNPFKVPTCFQRADLQQLRKERFRKGVVAAVASVAALLVIMLVQGCMSEQAKTSSNTTVPLKPGEKPSDKVVLSAPKPISTPAPLPTSPMVASTPAAPTTAPVTVTSQPKLVYVVKPGDSLSRIARIHQTTVKALKSVNGLTSDTIIVGDTLKLPSA